jgi:hypothetical protein
MKSTTMSLASARNTNQTYYVREISREKYNRKEIFQAIQTSAATKLDSQMKQKQQSSNG